MNPGTMQGFAGVDISDSDDTVIIHDVVFDRALPLPTGFEQVRRVEL